MSQAQDAFPDLPAFCCGVVGLALSIYGVSQLTLPGFTSVAIVFGGAGWFLAGYFSIRKARPGNGALLP